MSRHCRPAQRSRAVRARDALAELDTILAATAIGPEHAPVDAWAVAILADADCGGVPPRALGTLADWGLWVRDVHRGQGCWHCLATV